MRLKVYPFKAFIWIRNDLVLFIRPDYCLEFLVESYGTRAVPYGLLAIDEPDDILQPVGCIKLVSGAVHEDI